MGGDGCPITAEVALDSAAEGEGDEMDALGLLGRRAESLRRQQTRRRLRQERGRHVLVSRRLYHTAHASDQTN